MESEKYIKVDDNSCSDNYSSSLEYQFNYDTDKLAIINNINALKNFILNTENNGNESNNSDSTKEKIDSCFSQIVLIFDNILIENEKIVSSYESILRKLENNVRYLYSDIFNLKIKNTFLENNIDILLKKEKEYMLVKEKTGIVVENGAIVYNDRKDNEIFILRKENSTLKNVIVSHEKEIKDIKNKFNNEKRLFEKQVTDLQHKINNYRIQNSTNSKQLFQSNSTFNISNNELSNQNNNVNNVHLSQKRQEKNYETMSFDKFEKNVPVNPKNKINADLDINCLSVELKAKCYNLKKSNNNKNVTSYRKINNQIETEKNTKGEYSCNSIANGNNNSPSSTQKLLCLTPKSNENVLGINFQAFQKINNLKRNNIQINLEQGKRNTNFFPINSTSSNRNMFHYKKLKNSETNKTLINKRKKCNEVNCSVNQNHIHNNSKFKITKVIIGNKSNKDINKSKRSNSGSKNGGSKIKKKQNLSGLQSKKTITKSNTLMPKKMINKNKNTLQSPNGYKIK